MRLIVPSLLIVVLILNVECRRGGGGGFRGGGSRGTFRGSGSRGTGRYGGVSRTMSGRPRTSLYTRSIYSGSSRRSVNSNGFGLGLGVGMLVGYRVGFLARPRGYGDPNYSYNQEHQGEQYNQREDGLLECAIAQTTSYIKKMDQVQDIESEESTQVCSADQDICFATLTISNVNLTLTDGKMVDLLEIKVVKGCGKSMDYNGSSDDPMIGTYVPSRKCWISEVKTENFELNDKGSEVVYVNDNADQDQVDSMNSVTIFDFSGTDGMKDQLDLDSPLMENSDIKWQKETCICDLGDLCNHSNVLRSSLVFWGWFCLMFPIFVL